MISPIFDSLASRLQGGRVGRGQLRGRILLLERRDKHVPGRILLSAQYGVGHDLAVRRGHLLPAWPERGRSLSVRKRLLLRAGGVCRDAVHGGRLLPE